jgi:hypothetical protein
LAVGGLELLGAWLEYLYDDVWPFPWRGKLMAVLVALDEAEHQILRCRRPTHLLLHSISHLPSSKWQSNPSLSKHDILIKFLCNEGTNRTFL